MWGKMAVRKKNNGKWEADFYLDGKRVKKQCKTKREANQYIIKRKSTGTNHGENSFKTVNQAAMYYRDTHLKLGKASSNCYIINNIIKEFGDFKIVELKKSDVRLWITDLLAKKHYEISTIEKHLTYFKTIFNHCIKMELLELNPIEKVEFRKQFKKKNRRNVTMSHEDFREFYKLFENEKWYLKGVIKFLWHTGMRISEVLNLKWENIKAEHGVLVLDANDVKEGKIRTVSLEKEILDLLVVLKKENDKKGVKSKEHVFGVTGNKPLSYQTWWKNYRRITKYSEFSNFVTHDQRHSYSKRARQEGGDKEVIKLQMGHSTDSMYNYYNDIDEDELTKMSGFNREKIDLVKEQTKKLTDTMKEFDIPLGTVQASIRENL